MEKFMHYLKTHHKIIQNEIYGYEQISSNQGKEQITDHPGMKLILQAFKDDSPCLESWTDLSGSRIKSILSRLSTLSHNHLNLQPGSTEDSFSNKISNDASIDYLGKITQKQHLPGSSSDENDSNDSFSGMENADSPPWLEIKRMLKKQAKQIQKIEKSQVKHTRQMQKIEVGQSKANNILEEIVSEQEIIKTNQVDTAFLVHSLEKTTQDRDKLRLTVRSQAGKMGVVTKELNIVKRRVTVLEEEREQTIERSEIMEQMRIVNQDVRRAEKRIASHLGIKDQPMGDPSDNYPYSQWTDELCDEFRVKLKGNYDKAAAIERRCDLPPLEDFPDAAKSRLFQYGLGVALATPEITRNLENSPAKHKYDLVKLSGPIFEEAVVVKLRKSFEIQVEFLCDKLGEQYTESSKIYYPIEGDAFLSPEVMVFMQCGYSYD